MINVVEESDGFYLNINDLQKFQSTLNFHIVSKMLMTLVVYVVNSNCYTSLMLHTYTTCTLRQLTHFMLTYKMCGMCGMCGLWNQEKQRAARTLISILRWLYMVWETVLKHKELLALLKNKMLSTHKVLVQVRDSLIFNRLMVSHLSYTKKPSDIYIQRNLKTFLSNFPGVSFITKKMSLVLRCTLEAYTWRIGGSFCISHSG